jgi:hypothetical protein
MSLYLRRLNMQMPYKGSLRGFVPRAKGRMWNSIRLCRIGRVKGECLGKVMGLTAK